MTIEEAYQILKIDLSADDEEIRKAYHDLSLLYHPDITGEESSEQQAKLNEAYRIVIDFQKAKYLSVIPKHIESSLQQINKNFELAQFREDTNSYVKKIKVIKLSKIQQINYVLWGVTAVCGIFGFLSKEILPFFSFLKAGDPIFKMMTLCFGFTALFAQFIRETIKNKIDLITENYRDKHTAAFELSRILNFETMDSFDATSVRLNRRSEDLPPLMPFGGLTRYEQTKILILKAKENGLIEPFETSFLKPEDINKYKLKFDPADFKQFEEVEEPAKPLTEKDLKQQILGFGLASITCLGICGSIIYFLQSYWAVLPGFFTLVFGAITISSRSDFKNLKEKEETTIPEIQIDESY